MAVIDFGRLQLKNNLDKPETVTTAPASESIYKETEDDGKLFSVLSSYFIIQIIKG